MSIINFLIILSSVLLNAAAQIFLKKGSTTLSLQSTDSALIHLLLNTLSNWFIWGGLACYAFSVAIWILALSRVEVSTAYPMLSIGFIVSTLAAWFFLGESLEPSKIIGIILITIGVLIISRS